LFCDKLTEVLAMEITSTKIILLDGSKGAGKTTTGEILLQHLEGTVYLSVDNERRALPRSDKHITERNKEAFEVIMEKSAQYLDEGKNLIIDCGLIDERVARIEALAGEKNARVYKFLLKALYETQLDRVRSRDSAKDKETDEARFKEVHDIVHAKNFADFTVVDTDQFSPAEVADRILAILFI